MTYAELAAAGHPRYWDPVTAAPWTSWQEASGQWHLAYYEDPQSIAMKAELADAAHLRGVGIWALGMDGNDPAMARAVLGHATPVKLALGPAPTPGAADVFVVDDHAVVRVGVRSFLEGTGRFRVVAEASSLTEARMRMSTLPESTTFLIADMQLKGGSGIDIIREARLREPPLEVIVLTSFPSARILRRALAIGARGFVLKEAGGGALLEALEWAQKGHIYLDPRLGEAIVDALVFPDNVDRQASEERLLTLLADGLTDRDIARILSKPQATVSRDISLLLKRMGVTSRAAAVSAALRRGLLV